MYNILYKITIITTILDNLMRIFPKLLLFAAYLYCSGLLLASLFHGIDTVLAKGLMYDPIRLAHLQYKLLVQWWWPKKAQLGFMTFVKIFTSYFVPYLVFAHLPRLLHKLVGDTLDGVFTSIKGFFSFLKSSKKNNNSTYTHNQRTSSPPPKVPDKKYSKAEIDAMKKRIMNRVEKQLDGKLQNMNKEDK